MSRIEELEDIVQEFKQAANPSEIVDLKQLLSQKEAEIASLTASLGELRKAKTTAKGLFE